MDKGKTKKTRMWKRVVAILFAVVMIVSLMPGMEIKSYAMGEKWELQADGWYHLPGTDIKAKVGAEIITIEGNGEIPDYNNDTLSFRPWATSKAQYLQIGAGITRIGQKAFAKLDKLNFIMMSGTTFIADSTSFENLRRSPVFRIYGAEETTQMIGTIPYTSLDSIATIAQSGFNGASYVFDNEKLAKAFRTKTNPTIGQVYAANYKVEDGKKAPWSDPNDFTSDITYTNICSLSPLNPNTSWMVTGQRQIQGQACYQAFAAFIGNYQYATMFRLNVTKAGEVLTTTDNTYQYIWTIPEEYRMTGRTFKMLAIGTGTVVTYDDLDTSDTTFTMATASPSTAYCLVYVN